MISVSSQPRYSHPTGLHSDGPAASHAPEGESTAPTLHAVLQVIIHFLICHPGSSDTAETTHSGSFWVPHSLGLQFVWKCKERSSLGGGFSEKADLQPSGAASLHMFQSVGSCKNVSLVYIKIQNFSSTLHSPVGVWKLLFDCFSFFFFYLWPITFPSLSFTLVHLSD